MAEKRPKFQCGVPEEFCSGKRDAKLAGAPAPMVHGTADAALRCIRRDLLRRGYIRVGPHHYASPMDKRGEGEVVVLKSVH